MPQYQRIAPVFPLIVAAASLCVFSSTLLFHSPGPGTSAYDKTQVANLAFSSVLAGVALLSWGLSRSGNHAWSIFLTKVLVAMLAAGFTTYAAWLALNLRHQRLEKVWQKKMLAVQRLLELEPDCGYLWRPNLDVVFPAELRWIDTTVEGIRPWPLVTDSFGFRNHKTAIARQNESLDIIGLGDSFMHDAAETFYGFFSRNGYHYYSYAMHRHCPPQYNMILQKYALARKPTLALYGVFTNDFAESEDFENWRSSGMDWFKYHSGTWSGPPRKSVSSDLGQQYETVLKYVLEAKAICATNDIELTVLLIPSKQFIVHGKNSEEVTRLYDQLANDLTHNKVSVIDLRPKFSAHENRGELYWKTDDHWSYMGMLLAAREYLLHLECQTRVERAN